MGGVMDRIYAINPKHMHVNRPHYIPAPDELTNGLWSEPAVLHLTLRIRLADICRETADALPLGSDLVTVPYSKIAALDRLFHDLLVDMPALEAPVPMANHLSKRLATQRAIGILSVHARRARLLRPLLQVKDLAPRFQVFRRTCYQSVEAAIDISSRLLSANLNSLPSPPELATAANRSPLIINHVCIFHIIVHGFYFLCVAYHRLCHYLLTIPIAALHGLYRNCYRPVFPKG